MFRGAAAAFLVCAVLGVADAEAQYFGRNKVHYDRLDFRTLQTEHFDIYYYAEEEDATRHAARMAERWYIRFSRLLDHTFTRRQPLVLYASHPHFRQTNLTPGSPGESTGGFTEGTRSRIAMPFAAGLGETDHVLGHEIAHAFQIDIARRSKQNAFALPGWFIEGMAEYLSLGPVNAHTAMWLRDAALHDRLPTLKQLDDPRYFPYRFGHALWSYLGTRYGDEIVGQILRQRTRGGVLPRLERATGLDRATLTAEWHASITSTLPPRAPMEGPSRSMIEPEDDRTRLHLAPALSPDGTRLMFLSERGRLSLDLYLADAGTGRVLRRIVGTAADPHFDSLQYLHSAGAWDPAGRLFAMAAVSGGNPVLVIVNTDTGHRHEYELPALGEIYNPSWSPDGKRIVFSALKGGLSDLFLYAVDENRLEQLTADAFADLQPAWSPDGRRIAFASDRFTTSLTTLRFGPLRIATLDLETGVVEQAVPEASAAKQISPQWAPGARAIYFVSDRSGMSNVYRADLRDGTLRQVTDVATGVSGITPTSPALAVAAREGTIAYSVYLDGRYEIHSVSEGDAVAGAPVEPPAGFEIASRPIAPTNGRVAQMLADPHTGLPTVIEGAPRRYEDRLRLESVGQPFIGAATGNAFGGLIRASFGLSFSDVLRDRQLQSVFRVGTDIDDFAAQLAYTNRKGQWNWGLAAGVMPSRFVGAQRSIDRGGAVVTRETRHLRYLHEWGGLALRYNINRAQRLEFGAGVRRTGFEWQTVTRVIDPAANRQLRRELAEAPAGKPIVLAEASAAFVHDTAVIGPTGPILGQRVRLALEPSAGGLTFTDVRVDARRYFMPLRPFTIAVRAEHVGRYGRSASDPRLTPLVLGLQTLVRGYDMSSFAAQECGLRPTSCSMMDELTGGRLALLNVELRAPLRGLRTGDLDYGRLPVELIAFADAGFLWTRRAGAAHMEQDRFRSLGIGARVNAGGIVFELNTARPFDRAGRGVVTSLLIRPGF